MSRACVDGSVRVGRRVACAYITCGAYARRSTAKGRGEGKASGARREKAGLGHARLGGVCARVAHACLGGWRWCGACTARGARGDAVEGSVPRWWATVPCQLPDGTGTRPSFNIHVRSSGPIQAREWVCGHAQHTDKRTARQHFRLLTYRYRGDENCLILRLFGWLV